MKFLKTVRLTGALLAGVLLSVFSANSFAVGLTPSGTTISNIATVNYTVGTTVQTPIGSSSIGNTSGAGTATTFLVDTKVSLSVTTVDLADVAVSPGSTLQVMVFQVTNNGNATQGVTLSTVTEANGTASPFGGNTADFAATAISAFVSKNNTNAYVPANDTASAIPQLAQGTSNFVFIVASIPGTQVDGDVSVLAMKARADLAGGSVTYGTATGGAIDQQALGAGHEDDDSGHAWTPGTVQILFADAAGTDDVAKDGFSSSRDAYLVKSSKLTITKGTPVVLSDPTGDATPHAIPGAVMQYTVTIGNAASATSNATSITLTDALPANTAWGTATVGTLKVTTPGVNTGTQFACPDGSVHTQVATGGAPYTTVSCDFGQTTAGTVTVSGLALKPNDTTTIVYTVTIN